MESSQREYFLRQQLKAIQEELGEGDPEQAEIKELRDRANEVKLSRGGPQGGRPRAGAAREAAGRLGRVRRHPHVPRVDPQPARGTRSREDNLDLEQARKVLDEDHYDLDKVKERILEYLAVSKLKEGDLSGPILCFVGPPGVGKTSLGQSIARTLGRKFVRISVGGVRDEAEIRGHRRTYIGAMPGTIIRALRDAETKNPVFLIDEIDKMGADWRGDPASAMLEVLDPEQHSTFRDHYLDLPFDLSKVLFICTANQIETIPPPLLDRMDVISLSGYTEEEKLGIAKKYLVPKQLKAHGLTRSQLSFTDKGLRTIIREYTREAGVRQLERQIAAVCRKAARRIAEGETEKMSADEKLVREWLGPRRFVADVRKRTSEPGRRDGARRDRGRRRRPLHRGDRLPGRRAPEGHGPARRGHAGVGAGGPLLGADARGSSSTSTRTGSGRTTSTSTSRPAPCPRTGPRRESRWRRRSRRSPPASRSPTRSR